MHRLKDTESSDLKSEDFFVSAVSLGDENFLAQR